MAEVPEEQVQEAWRRYLAHRQSEARYRRIELILGGTVVFVLLAFVVASYLTVRANYGGGRLGERLGQTMASMTPEITEALLEVGDDVMPTYLQLGEEKFRGALPEVEAALTEEIERLWKRLGEQVRADFEGALERTAQKLERRLQEEFPELLEGPSLALLENELRLMVEKDTADFMGRFYERYAGELEGLYGTVDGFRPSRFDRLDDSELAVQYIHLWLTLLDRELLGLD